MSDQVAELKRALAESERRRRDLEDLLERERSERHAALADADAKATILNVLGRELRAPVNGALSWSRFVRRELLSQSGREHALGIAERHLDNVAHLVDDLLVIGEVGPPRAARIERVLLIDVFRAIDCTNVRLSLEPGVAIHTDAVRVTRLVSRFVATALAGAAAGVGVTMEDADVWVHLRASFEPLSAFPRAIPKTWNEIFAADNGPAKDACVGLFIAQRLAEAHGGELTLAKDSSTATLSLLLPSMPRIRDLRPVDVIALRAALQVLTIGLDLVQTRVRDAADEVPRVWLMEHFEKLGVAIERLCVIANDASVNAAQELGERPALAPQPLEAL